MEPGLKTILVISIDQQLLKMILPQLILALCYVALMRVIHVEFLKIPLEMLYVGLNLTLAIENFSWLVQR
jgi:hypothetical protein